MNRIGMCETCGERMTKEGAKERERVCLCQRKSQKDLELGIGRDLEKEIKKCKWDAVAE